MTLAKEAIMRIGVILKVWPKEATASEDRPLALVKYSLPPAQNTLLPSPDRSMPVWSNRP